MSSLQAAQNNLGVLYTGWLNKKNPVNGSYKKRFVVLTSESIHWFKREAKNDKAGDLFGEERGQIALSAVLSVRILDEDSNVLAIQATDRKTRYFKGESNTDVEEWVSAIRSAGQITKTKQTAKRGSRSATFLSNFMYGDGETIETSQEEVTVQIISIRCPSQQTEMVASRNPGWGRVIGIPGFHKDDELVISTSNGGLIVLNQVFLETRADQTMNESEVPIQGVIIPQSLRMTVARDGESKETKQTSTLFSRASELFVQCVSNRSASVIAMLSLLVIVVAANSLASISADSLLLVALSVALALFSITLVLGSSQTPSKTKSTEQSSHYTVTIKGHQYTSPDAPVHELDDEIPQRFINGCEGDLKEARRRWDITRHWREVERVNSVLQEPQPFFFVIRNHYAFYHAGRGRQGHVVFYERPGDYEQQQLKARGVTMEHMWRHWLFVTEYQWNVLAPGDMDKSISVIDMEHVSMGDLAGEKLEQMKRSVSAANAHYPERSFVIFIVNAPMWFSFIWKLVKPLVHENTQKKIKILSKRETLEGLQEHIDISEIPSYYGGKLDFGGVDSCRFKSKEVLDLENFVRELNLKAYGDNGDAPEDLRGSGGSPLPPGKRGHSADDDHGPKTTPSMNSPRDDDVWSVCSGKTTSTLHHK